VKNAILIVAMFFVLQGCAAQVAILSTGVAAGAVGAVIASEIIDNANHRQPIAITDASGKSLALPEKGRSSETEELHVSAKVAYCGAEFAENQKAGKTLVYKIPMSCGGEKTGYATLQLASKPSEYSRFSMHADTDMADRLIQCYGVFVRANRSADPFGLKCTEVYRNTCVDADGKACNGVLSEALKVQFKPKRSIGAAALESRPKGTLLLKVWMEPLE